MKNVGYRHLEALIVMVFFFPLVLGFGGNSRPAAAAVFCVDNSHPFSSDANPGTEDWPWKTIQKAADTLRVGDSVLVKAGTYRERVVCHVSGTAGAPIVFEGQRGPSGEWLTVVDGSDPVPAWEPAPDASPPVPYDSYTYKATLEYNPYAMVVGDKDIPRLGWAPGTAYEGYRYLRYPPDQVVSTEYERINVKYWDGLDALYYPVHDSNNGTYTVFLRFRDGDDPRSKDVRVAPAGAGFMIHDRSYIIIRDFKVLGVQNGIEIHGTGATHNIIEYNQITTGQKRVVLRAGAAYNHIRLNEMFMNGLSPCRPGGWNGARRLTDAAQRYGGGIKEHVYNVYKHEVGNGSTYSLDDDAGVTVQAPGPGNEIYQNSIHDTLGGVDVFEALHGLKIYGNTISHASSIGIGSGRDQFEVEIFDNLLCDSNSNFRVQDMDVGRRRVYFYRNRLYNRSAIGVNIYFHWSEPNSTPTELPEIWIYHNTFVGGLYGITSSDWVETSMAATRTYFLNNVFAPTPSAPLFGYVPIAVGTFDYNWAGGQHASLLPVWFGVRNVRAEGRQLWPEGTVPDFQLPARCAARRAGLDLSWAFALNGTMYPPLPGMHSGYFQGNAPDLGAVQDSDPERLARPDDRSKGSASLLHLVLGADQDPAPG